jgi:hypothetical protein
MHELGKVLKIQNENYRKTKEEQNEILGKLESFENWLNITAPRAPTTQEIANLCLIFEDKVCTY